MSYRYIAIKVNGKKKDLHRHLMENFLNRKLERWEVVHHINGDFKDNRLENLQVLSKRDHDKLHGLGVTIKSDSPQNRIKLCEHFSKLSAQEVLEIRKKFDAGLRIYQLAILYKVSRHVIDDVIRRKSWKHL